jgi:hypothetical protein
MKKKCIKRKKILGARQCVELSLVFIAGIDVAIKMKQAT